MTYAAKFSHDIAIMRREEMLYIHLMSDEQNRGTAPEA